MRRSLGGSSEAGTHGVPTRSWVPNRLRDVEVGGVGLRTPRIHCGTSAILLGVFVRKQAVPMVYDTSKREEGFEA